MRNMLRLMSGYKHWHVKSNRYVNRNCCAMSNRCVNRNYCVISNRYVNRNYCVMTTNGSTEANGDKDRDNHDGQGSILVSGVNNPNAISIATVRRV